MATSLTASTALPAPSEATAAKAVYLTHKLYVLQLFLLGGYCIMFLFCVLLIGYLRHNRNVALRGDASAARKIILPAFEPLLWILGGATGTYTIFFTTALAADLYTHEISRVSSEFFYSGRQFVFVSVIVFLFQKSVSIPALRRTLFLSFLLSTYTIPVVWYIANYTSASSDFNLRLMFVRGPLLVLYVYVLLCPPARASKRTLREFCMYTFIYYALLFAYIEMFRRKKPDVAFSLTYANIVWGSMCPLVIWRVLKADTEHWRGLGQRAVALQGLFRQRRTALDERVSSQGLHVLIEMHRRYIIDFAYLDIKQQIGSGASSTVFHGVLHGKTRVAVKVYTPNEFDEETVAAFSHEAALCGALHHPNIVKFYGMCVCPPSICLVSELCGGSLDDVVAVAHRQRDRYPNRQKFLLSISYMLDAARAVAYLHSFSPPFVHRDIKPSNFLVDFDGTVKLTDFGESRSLPRPNTGRQLHPYMVLASGAFVDQHGRYSGNTNNMQRASTSVGTVSSMTVRGTVDYMAPEVINGRAGVAAYGEAADIYSLAITMWDILNPGREKYPTLRNNHLQIFESVIEGKRPALDDSVHPILSEVIESAWQSDARLRPSAQNIVHILENIQEEIQSVFAVQLLDVMARASVSGGGTTRLTRHPTSSSLAECSFSGEEAVTTMATNGFVACASEAVRLGNALMDSGMLHHLHHTHSFSGDMEFYYFDEDSIRASKPMSPPGKGLARAPIDANEDEEKSEEPTSTRRSRTFTSTSSIDTEASHTDRHKTPMSRRPLVEQHGLCACRQLGQHLSKCRSRGDKRPKRNHKITTRVGTIMEEFTSTGLTRSLLAEEDHDGELETKTDHIAIHVTGPAAA